MAMAIALAAVAAQAEEGWFEITDVYRAGTSDEISTIAYFIYSGTLAPEAAVAAFNSAGASSYMPPAFTTRSLSGGGWEGYDDNVSGNAMYALCFDQDSNNKYMYVSPVANSQWDDGAYMYDTIDAAGSSSAAAMSASGGYQGAGWYSVATSSPIPEPTSGLLMLLGVAGLALKRKRA